MANDTNTGAAAPQAGVHAADLPGRDQTKPAEVQGLFRKFEVRRTDGSDAPGGKHYGCRYYVLDVDHDPHAAAALTAYAAACEATHPALARDLRDKWGAAPAAPQAVPDADDEMLGSLCRVIGMLEPIAVGKAETAADGLFSKTRQRAATITDARRVLSSALPILRRLFADLNAAQPAAQPAGYTDGGRNMFFDGLFDGETERERTARLRWANDMRAAFERHTGNGWFDKAWHKETGIWAAAWRAAIAAQPADAHDAARYRTAKNRARSGQPFPFALMPVSDWDAAIDAARTQEGAAS